MKSNTTYRDFKLRFLSLQDILTKILQLKCPHWTTVLPVEKKTEKKTNNGKLADTCRHLNRVGPNVTSFPHVPLVSSLHEECKVQEEKKKGKNKTQSASADASPCTHKTISPAFMPASRSPRHRVWSPILVVPTAQQLNPDGCQGGILLSLCTRFTDVSPRTHIPTSRREGGKDGERP